MIIDNQDWQLGDRVNVIGHGPGEVTGRSFSVPSRYDVLLLNSQKIIHSLQPIQIEGFGEANDDSQ